MFATLFERKQHFQRNDLVLKIKTLRNCLSKAQELRKKDFKKSRIHGFQGWEPCWFSDPAGISFELFLFTFPIQFNQEFNKEKKLPNDTGNHMSWYRKFRKLIFTVVLAIWCLLGSILIKPQVPKKTKKNKNL